MNIRFLVGSIIGAVLFLLLGWLLWGMALGSMMEKSIMPGYYKSVEDLNWLFQILGNLAWGLLMTYLLTKSNISGFVKSAMLGAVSGFLIAMGVDFETYGISNMYTSMSWLFVDLLANVVVFGIATGCIGAYLRMGKK